MPSTRPRRVAIAVRSWASEESVFVWTWAQKYFVRTGRDRDWLYIVHVNTYKDKSRDSWKAPGPTIPDLDRALQGYSYDIVELTGETAAHTLVKWVEESSIDVLVISAGRSRRLPNPMQSRTTDYIAAHASCATLVIHPKMSLADLTRVHKLTTPDNAGAEGIGEERRVAYAEESQEGLNIMMHWASCNISRPDDSEFHVMINRNSMLARVSKIIAPATRRRLNPQSASTSNSTQPHANLNASLEHPSTPNSDSAPLPAGAEDDSGAPTVLKGKPSQVIQQFVRDNNIDLLVIPVTPQATLKRMDKESKRDLKPSNTFMYHKAACTCLCVPAHLLKLHHGGPTATSTGLLLSEDEVEEEAFSVVPLAGSGHLSHHSTSPSRQPADLHMRHMEPIMRQDAHITAPAHNPEASEALDRGRHGSRSPPQSLDGQPRRRRSSAPATRMPSLTTASSSAATAAPSGPAAAANAATVGTVRSPVAIPAPATSVDGGMHSAPAQQQLTFAQLAPRNLPSGEDCSPRLSNSASPAMGASGGSSSGTPGAAVFTGVGTTSSGLEKGTGEKGNGGSGGIFSSLRSRVGKLNSSLSNGQRERKESKDSLTAQVVPCNSLSQPLPSVNFTSLDSQLSDLQCVLQEGGLSGEVRERGAEAVARARIAIATLSADACALRARIEEQEERRSMALAALSGTPQLPSTHTVLGGSGPLNGATGSSHGSGAGLHASPIAPPPPGRSHSNMSSGSTGGGVAAAAAAAVSATSDQNESCGAPPHTTHAPLTDRVSEPHFRVGGYQRMSTGAMGPSEPRSLSNERAADGRRLSHELLLPAGSSLVAPAAPNSAEENPTDVENSRSD